MAKRTAKPRKASTRQLREPTPLRLYFDANPKVRPVDLIAKLIAAGFEANDSSMSQWTTGRCAPDPTVWLAIETATDGKVTPAQWLAWRASAIKPRSRKSKAA